MGVSTNAYVVWGIRILWHDELNEAYDEVYDDADTPEMILDSMEAEYIVMGTQLFDSGDMRYGLENGDSCKKVPLTDLSALETKYKKQFVTKFPQFSHLMDEDFQIIMFTHYS